MDGLQALHLCGAVYQVHFWYLLINDHPAKADPKQREDYLVERLQSWGLSVTMIHGQMPLGDPRTMHAGTRLWAEEQFRGSAQVMVATEAAGEGINLQFCHLMIILISKVFITPDFGTGVKTTIRRGNIKYIVVDSRLSTGLPQVGFYYNTLEPKAMHYTVALDPADLTKFDGVQNVNRIYDSGNIIIYDVSVYA